MEANSPTKHAGEAWRGVDCTRPSENRGTLVQHDFGSKEEKSSNGFGYANGLVEEITSGRRHIGERHSFSMQLD